ncbi:MULTISPECIES: DUF1697 domain-containing protein [unclassified Allomuricauda]|uniref:DUF1697 domain-containing protein n=1 Tax=unclassified Allomuricauda TaxID=2615049 RepID=UPI00273EC911|nr:MULTISPECIES: DUF1697 domain-containing protein [unclassified Allomuricauda]
MADTFIALLRGINVSGQKKIKMAELRAVLEDAGLQNVTTYIQSGNLVFDSEESQTKTLQELINSTILKHFGFEVPTLVVQRAEIQQFLEDNPFLDTTESNKLYYVLLQQRPKEEFIKRFHQLNFEHEDFHITDNCVYLQCKKGYGKAKLNNNLIERKLQVQATTRNDRTLRKLLELSAS